MTLEQVHAASDRRAAFDVWARENRGRIAKASASIWWRFFRRAPTPEELDDLIQDALLAAWQAVVGYAWICPRCRLRLDSRERYEWHLRENHGLGWVEPVASLARRVFYCQGSAAQRAAHLEAFGSDAHRRVGARVNADDVLRPASVPACESTSVEIAGMIRAMTTTKKRTPSRTSRRIP